jgi:HK97 family phage major capsid protein
VGATDQMLARLSGELEERQTFIDGLVEAAQKDGRDINPQEMELITRARDRISVLSAQLDPLGETVRISRESQERARRISAEVATIRSPEMAAKVEYRSVGAYIADLYHGQLGDQQAAERLQVFNRAAAHQLTTDNPGLLPESIVSPIVNYIEVQRPLINSVGVTDLGPGAWSYARVTQHTQVGVQSAEKTELASRKMTITKTALGASTFGGYLNVSKQDIQRSSPQIMDMVIQDLAEQYAIETEEEMGSVMTAAATAGPVIPVSPTGLDVATAIWGAAGSVFAATKGQGRTVVAVSPDQLGAIGPLFPNVNPQNAYSTGFPVGSISQGPQGTISGLTVIMSAGLATDTILVYSTAAVKAFEYRYGNLQVVEPSVWGVQVGYAGDFDAVVVEAAGIVRVTTA